MNEVWTITLVNICVTLIIIMFMNARYEHIIKRLKNDFGRCNILFLKLWFLFIIYMGIIYLTPCEFCAILVV
jgi:hypothetical protein